MPPSSRASSLPPSPETRWHCEQVRAEQRPCPAAASSSSGSSAPSSCLASHVGVVGRRQGHDAHAACTRGTGRRTRCTGRGTRRARRPRSCRGWHAPGHGVLLAVERGDPERVDDVARGDGERDRLAGGDHQVVGGDDVVLAVAVDVVAVLPPPLLTDDRDLAGRPSGGLVEVEQGEHGRDADAGEQEGGEDRPAELELGVAVDLGRQAVVVVLALAVPPGEVRARRPGRGRTRPRR